MIGSGYIFLFNPMNTINLQLFTILLLTLNLSAAQASGKSNQLLPLTEQKKQLSITLDSLDLLKQDRKRAGHTFTDLDLKQNLIRDSLQLIRSKIQHATSTDSKSFKTPKSLQKILSSYTAFDWFLVILATSALFAGILLLYGVMSKMLTNKRKEPLVKPSQRRQFQVENPIKSQPTIGSGPGSNDYSTTIKLQNIEDTSYNESAPNVVANFPTQPDFKADDISSKKSTSEIKNELEQKVVNAVFLGMSIQEVSRKFHLSSDHVSLIIKLSENTKSK